MGAWRGCNGGWGWGLGGGTTEGGGGGLEGGVPVGAWRGT